MSDVHADTTDVVRELRTAQPGIGQAAAVDGSARSHETAGLEVVDVAPARAAFRRGETWRVRVTVRSDRDREVNVAVEARTPDAATARSSFDTRIAAGESTVEVDLPGQHAGAGRQLVAEVRDSAADGSAPVRAVGAADVLDDWRADPRYGFLCDFAPGSEGVEDRVARMARHHISCVLLYDWAWRHHELLAPEEPYADVLGKPMSLASVERAIDACHAQGMAALGYATVYAAERDFLDAHPGWGLLDDDGRPWQLADLFFLMDVRGGSLWSRHMLEQLDRTLDAVDLDGFHLDQYGWPRTAHLESGERVDVATGFAAFVRAAGDLLIRKRPGGGSIFNNVNAWPLEGMAGTAEVATYVEVWRPHTDYHDLVQIVARARRSEPGKPVVLAAYAALLSKTDDPGEAAGGLALLAAVTLAAGGWPLLVGEGEGVLTGAYYPEHVTPPEPARAALASVLDAGVAWRAFLRGEGVERVADAFVDGQDCELSLDLPWSSRPLPGHVWVSVVERPGWVAVSLVNLLDATSARWNRPQPTPVRREVTLRLPQGVDRSQCWVSGTGLPWERLPVTVGPEGASVRVPLGVWSLVVLRDEGTSG